MLDVRKLRALREVALRGSFSDAAARLGYTQSAVSQQIAQLERQAGTLLLERRGRTIRLTPAGRALVECADAVLRRLVDAEDELEAITGLRHGSLRLAAFAEAVATCLPPAIRRFRARQPGVRVCLATADAAAAAALVEEGEAEIAVAAFPAGGTDPSADRRIQVVHLFDDPMRVALPADHPLADRPALDLTDLAEDPWIVGGRSGALGESFAEMCARAGLKLRVAVRADDPLAVHGLVAAGLGVAFLPALSAGLAVRSDVVVRPLRDDETVRHVVAIVRAGVERSPAVSAMLTELIPADLQRRRLGIIPPNPPITTSAQAWTPVAKRA